MIYERKQVSEHFNSYEFVCQHCGNIKIDENLINKMEHIFNKLNASKCIISSGYRCATFDKQIGGFLGRHYEGLAADCVYYDKSGNMIPSKIVCCVAYDLGELNGIAKIDNYYVHLDNRQNGYYRGDESRGNSNYWDNPYSYFGVSKQDVIKYTGEIIKKSVDEIAKEIINDKNNQKWGTTNTNPTRKQRLESAGYNYQQVQDRVNEILGIKKQTSSTKKLYLPASANSWRVYPLDKAPYVGNECGYLRPSKFGGLTYDIIRYVNDSVVVIKTRDFGTVQIYVAPDTGAVIK